MSFRHSFRLAVASVGALAAVLVVSPLPSNGNPIAPSSSSPTVAPSSDPLLAPYPAGFALTPLSAEPIQPITKPAPGTFQADPAYGTHLYRATNAEDGQGGRLRHEYSRRQAFNADQSRYLAQDASGYWHLYDGATLTHIAVLPDFAGDCEPIWHPTDPGKLYFTSRDGGMVWWLYDIASETREVVFDFTGQTPWPDAASFWTKGEGTMSADGRYLSLMASTYHQATQTKTIYGLVTLDVQERRIVGTLDAADFPVAHAEPDHISTSPSGGYAVPSWNANGGGTWAYTLDFGESRRLISSSEHSDLAFGPNGEDYLVAADYSRDAIVAVDLATAEATPLHPLYPASGEAYALHISGQAFDKPGWVVVSTYADSANYGTTWPSPTLRPEYRKVWLMELKPDGRKLNVAHTQVDWEKGKGNYFLEPQASVSRDLSRVIFASDFGTGTVESFIVPIPAAALDSTP